MLKGQKPEGSNEGGSPGQGLSLGTQERKSLVGQEEATHAWGGGQRGVLEDKPVGSLQRWGLAHWLLFLNYVKFPKRLPGRDSGSLGSHSGQ